MSNTDQPGGSGTGRTVANTQQNVVIDANAQAAAAQLAQQILANTNVTLKQELVKIPDFWGEKGKDTVTAAQFMARSDECQRLERHHYLRQLQPLSQRGSRRMACFQSETSGAHCSSTNVDQNSPAFQKGIRRLLR